MEFKLKIHIVTLEPHTDRPGMFKVTRGCCYLDTGTVMSFESIMEQLTPVGCDSVDLVDPGRNERLCPPIINSPKPFKPIKGGCK